MSRSIRDSLPLLQELDDLRTRAESLRDGALRSLDEQNAWESAQAPDQPDWLAATFVLRAENLAGHLGMRDLPLQYAWWQGAGKGGAQAGQRRFETLLDLRTVRKGRGAGSKRENAAAEDVDRSAGPLLFAATYMRAFIGRNPSHWDGKFIASMYRSLVELGTIVEGDQAVGSLRARPSLDRPSAFVTASLARVLGNIASAMRKTRAFLKQARETLEYQRHVEYVSRSIVEALAEEGDGATPSMPLAEHFEDELQRLVLSLVTQFESERTSLAIHPWSYRGADALKRDVRAHEDREPGQGARALAGIRNRITKSIKVFVDRTRRELNKIMHAEVKGVGSAPHDVWRSHLKAEPQPSPSKGEEDADDLGVLKQSVAVSLGVALADDFLRSLEQCLNRAHARLGRSDAEGGMDHDAPRPAAGDWEDWEFASECVFRPIETLMETYLGLIAQYATRGMHEGLYRLQASNRVLDVQDIAFCAVTAGHISRQWDDPAYADVVRCLCAEMDDRGLFPQGRPFQRDPSGFVRMVVNAHVIKAVCQVAEHCTADCLTAKDLLKMVRWFESTRREGHGRAVPGGRSRAEFSSPGTPGSQEWSEWATAVSALALHRLCRLLNVLINREVLRHFTVETPERLEARKIPRIRNIMVSDLGSAALDWSVSERTSITMLLERMRRHLLLGPRKKRLPGSLQEEEVSSLIIYGPPGTGKSTLVKGLGVSARCPVVTVTPGDFLVVGGEHVEAQARAVMKALSLLTRVVILFDELDPMIASRDGGPGREAGAVGGPDSVRYAPESTFDFITGSMLPKLAELHDRAAERQTAYVLATNFVEHLDAAAIRVGRFDAKRYVYFPDLACRIVRLLYQVSCLLEPNADGQPALRWSERGSEWELIVGVPDAKGAAKRRTKSGALRVSPPSSPFPSPSEIVRRCVQAATRLRGISAARLFRDGIMLAPSVVTRPLEEAGKVDSPGRHTTRKFVDANGFWTWILAPSSRVVPEPAWPRQDAPESLKTQATTIELFGAVGEAHSQVDRTGWFRSRDKQIRTWLRNENDATLLLPRNATLWLVASWDTRAEYLISGTNGPRAVLDILRVEQTSLDGLVQHALATVERLEAAIYESRRHLGA